MIDAGEMTAADFARFAALAAEASGVVLTDAKRQMVRSRLMRRLRALGVPSFADYAARLEDGDAAELQNFLNAITTHHTGFFREPHHFDTLETAVKTWSSRNLDAEPIKIWSAACSSGQEPYSIGVTLLRAAPDARRQRFKVLATDIDTSVVAQAAAGRYRASDLQRAPRPGWTPYFEAVGDAELQASSRLKALIAFRRLNLLEDWPIRGQFDAIFCRNVIIYFDNETKAGLLRRLRAVLKPGGLLFLGHSETLADREGLESIGRTTFLKKA